MTTKSLSRKQVIVPMSNDNKSKFMELSSAHIINFNKTLKSIKSEVMADFVHANQAGIIIITNKVTSLLDLQTIKKYIKSSNHIDTKRVKVSHLPQSKYYLKIISIPYHLENTNTLISANIVEFIIKSNHIFNNILIASRSYIIKILLKSDMVIIWLNIWDIKSGNNAKGLINRCFNVRSYTVTIYGVNMNPGVLYCKNC